MASRVALLVVVVAACAEPRQYDGPIPIVPGAAARAMAIMQRGGKADAGAPAARATVRAMLAGEELGGPNATGRAGDLVLANAEVAFVIDQLGAPLGFAESGGNIVDAADAHVRKDELSQIWTSLGTFPRQAIYTELTSGEGADGSAWIEAKGRDLDEAKLQVVTRYTLAAADRAVLVTTKLENGSDRPIEKLALGDAIQWGGAEAIAPTKALGFHGASSGAYVGGIGRFVSYATASTDGDIDATTGATWSDTVLMRDVTLAPGQKTDFARVLAVGKRGDSASLIAELTQMAGGTVGEVAIDLVGDDGKSVKTPAGAKVALSNARGDEIVAMRSVADGDPLGGELPPGLYTLSYASGGGRKGSGAKATIDVDAGKTAHVALHVTAAGSLETKCTEIDPTRPSTAAAIRSLPCKITLEDLDGGPIDLGPSYVAGPARHQITTATGDASIALAPGRYAVTASRGPEYETRREEVVVGAAAPAKASFLLHRAVDTAGYLAIDFHQHTTLGPDSPVTPHDRVIANAAEGVEVAIASEHNVYADLEPIVRELGLAPFLVELPGVELTSDANDKPWGHANVFPVTVDPTKPRGGAPDVRNRSPRDLFAELRRTATTPLVIQVNHPRYGAAGYFLKLGFDAKTGVGTDAAYDATFDALEVWNGRNVVERDAVLADYIAMLAAGHVVTPSADSDTHGVVGEEGGYPRTFVRVTNDAPPGAWDAARSADLVSGIVSRRDVVLSNGPFVRVAANGVGPGGVVKGRDVTVNVHIECAPWVSIDTVRLARARGKGEARTVKLAPLPSTAMGADAVFRVHAEKDDALVVVVSGAAPMTPVLSGDTAAISPWAMTSALFVDADGDGKALGR